MVSVLVTYPGVFAIRERVGRVLAPNEF